MAQAKSPAVEPTRGEYNNNPGNIVYAPRNDWVGQIGIEKPRSPKTLPRFARFESPIFGGRAIVQLLGTYQAQGTRTVRSIIGKWAPPSENDTDAYIATVAQRLGVGPDTEIDVKRYEVARALLEAIIRHENGRVIYTPAELDEMLYRAGIVKPGTPDVPRAAKSPAKSATAAAGVSGGGVISAAITIANEPTLRAALETSGYKWPLAMLAVAGVLMSAYVAYRALRANRPAAS